MIKRILKYYDLVVPVMCCTAYYLSMQEMLSDRRFLQHIKSEHKIRRPGVSTEKPDEIIYRVNVVINRLFPHSSCIIRSLVIRKVLLIKGFSFYPVKIGVQRKNGVILAHAWISRENRFVKIEEL
jgi:hypothetical protein